jgi:hypothetical protein
VIFFMVGDRDYRRLVQSGLQVRQLSERAAQRLLGLLAGCDVTRDLGEATELTCLVPKGRDNDVGLEERAVLANPQTLFLEAALDGSDA